MAMIDYGAIVFKNGKCITTDMFTDMKDAVGWEDTENDLQFSNEEPLKLKGNYFTYIGDKDCTLGFYKTILTVVRRYNDNTFFREVVYFNNRFEWRKWTNYLEGNNCIVKKKNGYYVLHWKYKNDKYKVCFGHGVDIWCYQKYHVINYYRSLPYYAHNAIYYCNEALLKLKRKLKNMFKNDN